MKKAIGLDLGTSTLGIAVSDVLGIAHPRKNFRFPEGAYKRALAKVMETVECEGTFDIALGYPLNMDGTSGESAQRSERFKNELLQMDSRLSITLIDERLTTVMASKAMTFGSFNTRKQKKVIDQQSAVLILESYLSQKEREQ